MGVGRIGLIQGDGVRDGEGAHLSRLGPPRFVSAADLKQPGRRSEYRYSPGHDGQGAIDDRVCPMSSQAGLDGQRTKLGRHAGAAPAVASPGTAGPGTVAT